MSLPFEHLAEAACIAALGAEYIKAILLARLRGGPATKDELADIVDKVIGEFGFVALLKMAILDKDLAIRMDESGELTVGVAAKAV